MLGRDERLRFHEQGFLGPLPLASAHSGDGAAPPPGDGAAHSGDGAAPPPGDRVARLAPIVAAGSTLTGHGTYARHLDSRPVYDLCTDPAVVAAVASILGEDLLLWNSSFWIKSGESARTPWHQDVLYWPIALTVTAWIALTDVDESSGCLEVVPGSQLSLRPVVRAGEGALFEYEADPDRVEPADVRALPARAGEFILLGDRTLHRSAAHRTEPDAPDRWALAARYTVPSIWVPPDRLPVFPGHHCVLVSGTDRFGVNTVGPAPAGDDGRL